MIKGIFSLPLRALQGFIDTIFALMNVLLRSPNYTSISKRSKTVQAKYKNKSKGSVHHIAIDSTGLKVFGEREWKVKKHGVEKRRTWRKLHLAHDVINAEVSLVNVGDSDVLPTLLNPLRRKVHSVLADCASDKKKCHEVLQIKASQKKYWLLEKGFPRNDAVNALKSDTLSLRCYNAQVGEALANIKAMNKVLGLGVPIRN